MCGISGIIERNASGDIGADVRRMCSVAAHRGPDGEGILVENGVALGHRRLAILDLSDLGAQPMHHAGGFSIIHNGEVYNYRELRSELEKLGHSFKTQTDTEVIVTAYAEWGERCVQKFNGMWAFAILDRNRRKLFCSRDRYGIKPFYYSVANGRFIFGSEIRQLRAVSDYTRAAKNTVADYLFAGREDHDEHTFFDGIQRLLGSHNLVYDLDKHTFEITRYYDLRDAAPALTLDGQEALERFDVLFRDAISLRLRSDVLVGTCLSGGLDSSSIAAIASEQYRGQTNTDFKAIHARALEAGRDESHFAKLVAKRHALDLKIVEPDTGNFFDLIDEVVETQEEPFGGPSIFMQYLTFRAAKEAGCKVMLDGQGADETLFGYETYYVAYMSYLLRVSTMLKFIECAWHAPGFKISRGACIAKAISYRLRRSRANRNGFQRKYPEQGRPPDESSGHAGRGEPVDTREFQILAMESEQLPRLLRYEDRNSMRHSVESRLPFLDYRLAELAIGLGMEYKVQRGYQKYVLRQFASAHLPEEIAWRRDKYGFEAPVQTWMQALAAETERAYSESGILNEMAPNESDRRRSIDSWRAFNLARWARLHDIDAVA